MPQPSVRTGHIDQLLTNISVSYMQQTSGYIADQVFPVVPVAKSSDFYYVFPRGWFLRDEVGPRPMGGVPRAVGHGVDRDSYIVEEEALEAWLDDRERANATPPYDPEASKVKLLTQHHLIHRDKKWVDAYFKSGVWGTDLTGVAAAPGAGQFLQWDNDNSDPMEFIDERKDALAETTGMEFNVLVLGRTVFRKLKRHPAIIELIKYTNGQAATQGITREMLAGIFGVDRVVVPSAIQNTGNEVRDPATGDIIIEEEYSFIASPKDALLVHSAPEAGLDVATGGYIFAWTGLLGGRAFTPSGVWRGRRERAYSDWFHVRMAYDMKVVAPDLGVFFSDAVA